MNIIAQGHELVNKFENLNYEKGVKMARREDSKILNVLVKEQDRQRIGAYAKARNQTLSEYIRGLIEADMGEQLEPIEHGGYRERKSGDRSRSSGKTNHVD